MSGFYEEMAEFAAMSEGDGFLGRCGGEFEGPQRTDDRRDSHSYNGNLLPRRPVQLELLVIEKSPNSVAKAG